ncbi:hypothetical protein IWW34DRAFT_795739 [Fusarium oxysporum f. sp. albedinis]|nr:hypothetical protein IWW34DRAFT_795739 [Fusarium oxysporum f. sp. albedinis]
MTQERLPKDKLPQKIQEALGRFERDNKKVGYACSMHEHIVNREPGSYCKWCTGIVTETPVQAHRELYCGNTFSEYDWETINEEGIWVEGKGEDEGWKIYSKRTDYHPPGFMCNTTQTEIALLSSRALLAFRAL